MQVMIVVSPKNGEDWPSLMMPASTYDAIIAGTRAAFAERDMACFRLCVQAHEEWSLEYIALDEVDAACFRKFAQACEVGLQRLKDTGKPETGFETDSSSLEEYIAVWEKLLEIIRFDPRMSETA